MLLVCIRICIFESQTNPTSTHKFHLAIYLIQLKILLRLFDSVLRNVSWVNVHGR